MPTRPRPYVICHMVPSVDGKIVTSRWPLSRSAHREYERTAKGLDADGWMIGRISMEPYAGRARISSEGVARVSRRDFIGEREARAHAIVLDPQGKLEWETGEIDGDHVVAVLTQRASDAHLALLRSKGVSYLFGGRDDINLARVLQKLRERFGIRRLLLEGGGTINGSFLAADLIDEVSVLVAPFADGSVGTPTMFDSRVDAPARGLSLKSVERRPGGLVWLRYVRSRRAAARRS